MITDEKRTIVYPGRKSPQYIAILIDQSESTRGVAERISMTVQEILLELVLGCISGDSVKGRFYISLISYGGLRKVTQEWQGWISDKFFVDRLWEANERDESIIPSLASANCPMAQAFDSARNNIKEWLVEMQNNKDAEMVTAIPFPVVVNVTAGSPDSEIETVIAATKLQSLASPDSGNVFLMNMVVDEKQNDGACCLPRNGSIRSSDHFLMHVSSILGEELNEAFWMNGLMISHHNDSRAYLVNGNGDIVPKLFANASW